MGSFVWTLIPLITGVSLGIAVRLLVKIDVRAVGKVSFYVFTPCLVFQKLLRTELGADDAGRIVAVVILLFLALGAVGLVLGRAMRWEPDKAAAVMLVLLFMNAGNFGLSFNQLQYGDAGLEIASIYFITNVILLNTAGVIVAARGKVGWRETIGRTIRVPLIYAVPVALLFRYLGVPWDHQALIGINKVADGTVPLLLVILGMQLASLHPGKDTVPSILPAVLRLVLSPLIAYGLARGVGLEGLPLKVVTIQAAMPAAINNLVLALQFDTRPRFVGAMILVSTVACLVTLGVVVHLLGG